MPVYNRLSTPPWVREKFLDLGKKNNFKLDDEFFSTLSALASKATPLELAIRDYGIQTIKIDLRDLKQHYFLAVHAIAYNYLNMISNSKTTFSSEKAILITPNNIYDKADRFHTTITEIIDLVKLVSADIVVTPPLIEKRKGYFCRDEIHLSQFGANRVYRRVEDLTLILGRNLSQGNTDFPSIISEFKNHLESLKTTQKYTGGNRYRNRDPNAYDTGFDDTYYPIQESQKKMSFYYTFNSLNDNGKFPLGFLCKKLLFIMHTTSMFRDFICKSAFSKNKRQSKTLFKLPAGITVSPGGTAQHIASDILTNELIKGSNVTCYISIFHVGNNEKLALQDFLQIFLCNSNIRTFDKCPICNKYPNCRKPHYFPKALRTFMSS